MAGLSLGFKDSKALMQLYGDISAPSGQISVSSLDQSLPTIDYSNYRLGQPTTPDKVVQSEELFFAVAKNPALHSAYRRFAKAPLPWKPTNKSRQVLREFDAMVRFWREANPEEPKLSLALAKEIFNWVTRPESRGGLGIKYDEKAPEQTFDQVVKSKRGECTEMTYIHLALFSRVGFKVTPIWVGKANDGRIIQHAVAALDLGGKRYLMDSSKKKFNAGYRHAVSSSHGQFLAWYWSNRGIDFSDKQPNRAESYYRRALQMDPRNPYFYSNLGALFIKQKEWKKAEVEFRKALAIAPKFAKGHEGLGDVYFERLDFKKAATHYQAAISANPRLLATRKKLVRSTIGVEDKKKAQLALGTLKKWAGENRDRIEPVEFRSLIHWMASQDNIIKSL